MSEGYDLRTYVPLYDCFVQVLYRADKISDKYKFIKYFGTSFIITDMFGISILSMIFHHLKHAVLSNNNKNVVSFLSLTVALPFLWVAVHFLILENINKKYFILFTPRHWI